MSDDVVLVEKNTFLDCEPKNDFKHPLRRARSLPPPHPPTFSALFASPQSSSTTGEDNKSTANIPAAPCIPSNHKACSDKNSATASTIAPPGSFKCMHCPAEFQQSEGLLIGKGHKRLFYPCNSNNVDIDEVCCNQCALERQPKWRLHPRCTQPCTDWEKGKCNKGFLCPYCHLEHPERRVSEKRHQRLQKIEREQIRVLREEKDRLAAANRQLQEDKDRFVAELEAKNEQIRRLQQEHATEIRRLLDESSTQQRQQCLGLELRRAQPKRDQCVHEHMDEWEASFEHVSRETWLDPDGVQHTSVSRSTSWWTA